MTTHHRDREPRVGLLITLAAVVATAAWIVTAPGMLASLEHDPLSVAAMLALALALQLFSVEVYGRGSLSVSAVGLLTAGFALGPGPAITIGFLTALVQWARVRGLAHRAIFDLANLGLSAGAGGLVYDLVAQVSSSTPWRIVAATAAGAVYCAINTGLLCLAMGLVRVGVGAKRLARAIPLAPLSLPRLRPARPRVYDRLRAAGLRGLARLHAAPGADHRFRPSVPCPDTRLGRGGARGEQAAAARERGSRCAKPGPGDFFQLAGGLAARAHDRIELVAYAERRLSAMTGAAARIRVGSGSGGVALAVGGHQVGSLSLVPERDFDEQRWERLREAVLPHLATAIESTELVEKVRRTHLATIAALSRSIEAKDYYTGGHTERVAAIAVALAGRLGLSGVELDAIEVGALLHDIGKIGIPERILHKADRLDPEEWQIMTRHPLISEQILAAIDLPPTVRQIARSSHERIDGLGYPDGLVGQEIPLPARIVLVADAFDALTTDRPYRAARTVAEALAEIRAHSGTQFCPRVVAALDRIQREQPELLGGPPLRVVAAAS